VKKHIILFLSAALISCTTTTTKDSPPENSFYFCAAIFSFIINPDGDLESFKYLPPMKCGGGQEPMTPSDAWLKTACGHFTTRGVPPTYKEGGKPVERFMPILANPNRPNVIYPTRESGKSKNNPVIHVDEAILIDKNPDSKDACDYVRTTEE
jgi:hypothetical protein